MQADLISLTARQRAKRINGPVTYFLQAEDGGPIKIGLTDWDVIELRIRTLQCGHPDRLVVRSILEGDHESEMHQRFADLRIRNEWFFPHPRLARFARALASPQNEDRFALTQAYRDGFRRGWSEGVRELAEDAAEIASGAVRQALRAAAIESLAATPAIDRRGNRPHRGRQDAA